MDRLLYAKMMKPACPAAWQVFLRVTCGVRDFKLCKRLWQHLRFYERQPILMAINQLSASQEPMETVKRLYAAIPPRLLLTVCLRVSPEGRVRDPRIVKMENRILEQSATAGEQWRGEQ